MKIKTLPACSKTLPPRGLTARLLGTFIFALALCGCSKNLTRDRAAVLIESQPKFKATSDAKVVVGRFWYDWRNVAADFPFESLAMAGLLSIRETGNTYGVWWKEYIVDLTEAGQLEAKSWVRTSEEVPRSFGLGPESPGATVHRIPIASKKLIEVTGIVTDPSGRQAEIEFTWNWTPSSQAKLLPNLVPSSEVHQERALAQLYDDGWRVERFYGLTMEFMF